MRPFLVAVLFAACAVAQSPNALEVFRTGDYKTALPLLTAAANANPGEARVQAALLSALVYEGQLAESVELAGTLGSKFPTDADVTSARGELAFYRGDMADAERSFKAALRQDPKCARAYLGLHRLAHAASMFRTARMVCMQAYQLDSGDAAIMVHFSEYLTGERRKEILPKFRKEHPWFFPHGEEQEQTAQALRTELEDNQAFEPQLAVQEQTVRMRRLMKDATHLAGFGLECRFEDGKPLTLLLDTGASGILISEKAIDRFGLNHLGSMEGWGIGDAGERKMFAAVARTCDLGGVGFKSCIVHATSGKKGVTDEIEGLIGLDVFADYVVQLDFQRSQMHLTPQPKREPSPQGYDRTIPESEKTYTPVLRGGSHLYVSTQVNEKQWGLFLIDTGSQLSSIDSEFARESTKIRGDDRLTVKGISGKVAKVYAADEALIRFGHFQQRNPGLPAFDLNGAGHHTEFRMAGILGMPTLYMFRLTLDYRNGLVNFDYILPK